MATSPAHKFGQILGNLLEEILEPIFVKICTDRGLYLDIVGKSRSARSGKKVSWEDIYGNKHDLDFVIEFSGTNERLGKPIAFIEVAWRRYTKHSKNKAQEIQGALLPIADRFKHDKPFLGAIVAGEFTAPSLAQLKSSGFEVLYFQYASLVTAFKTVGLDIEYGEDTSDVIMQAKVVQIENISVANKSKVMRQIINLNQNNITIFETSLVNSLDRQPIEISILPSYGLNQTFLTTDEAIEYLMHYDTHVVPEHLEFQQFTIIIKYTNGDKITAELKSIEKANDFLNKNT